ncbi:MAG: single-strand binding protein [Dehalococcoidia bacterium]|nr:single-strand binding protein [Dehalococcoidia bacterium]
MPGLNKIMVIGNVGRDPEMRYAPSGNAVTTFSVATSRNYNGRDGEKKEETEWFTVEAWNRLAEITNQYVTKGRKVYVEGRFHLDTWSGTDGQQHSRAKIVATDFQLLDRPGPPGMREEGEPVAAAHEGGGMDPEDLPF